MKIKQAIENTKHLTPIEQNIANYILENPEEVISSTIQKTSENLYISKSAILRFCKKIGLKGYNDLKVQLAKDFQYALSKDSLLNVNYPFLKSDGAKSIANKMLQLYEVTIQDTYHVLDFRQLEQIAKEMNQASCIDIYTHAHNLNVADNFKDKMLMIAKNVHTINDFYSQRLYASASNADHVALILSYSGKASWMEEILKKLKEKHTKTIFIGKSGSNPFPSYIDEHIEMSNLENVQSRISQFSSHISLQYVMDVLYSIIYRLNIDQNNQYLLDSIDYLDDRRD